MQSKRVMFTKKGWSVGRNGSLQTTGLEIEDWGSSFIAVYPVTTKGKPGRCSIEIEKDAIPELIKVLETLV